MIQHSMTLSYVIWTCPLGRYEEAIAIPWRSLPKRVANLYFAMRGMLTMRRQLMTKSKLGGSTFMVVFLGTQSTSPFLLQPATLGSRTQLFFSAGAFDEGKREALFYQETSRPLLPSEFCR